MWIGRLRTQLRSMRNSIDLRDLPAHASGPVRDERRRESFSRDSAERLISSVERQRSEHRGALPPATRPNCVRPLFSNAGWCSHGWDKNGLRLRRYSGISGMHTSFDLNPPDTLISLRDPYR